MVCVFEITSGIGFDDDNVGMVYETMTSFFCVNIKPNLITYIYNDPSCFTLSKITKLKLVE